MCTTRILLLAGAAALAFVGLSGLAQANTPRTHVLTVQLPNGVTEQIRYTGDVPPQVVLMPEAMSSAEVAPRTTDFDAASPFAMLQRISAEMDREAAAMFQATDSLMSQPDPGSITEAALGRLPAGTEGYSLISTFSGAGVCTRSVQISYSGGGQKPRIVSSTAGDCGGSHHSAAPTELPGSPEPAHQPRTIQVKANSAPAVANPYRGLVHQVGDWRR